MLMSAKIHVGADAERLARDQITQYIAGIEESLSIFNARSAVSAWIEVLRGVEELINIPKYELEDKQQVDALLSLRMDNLSPIQVKNLERMLTYRFRYGTAQRFVQTLVRSAAIGSVFWRSGLIDKRDFRTLADVIAYFQSRRRQMLALLYWMPAACCGTEPVDPLDALNIFLPIVEQSCVSLSSFYRDLVLLRVYDDYALTISNDRCTRSHSYVVLDNSSLEPERAGITEVPPGSADLSVLKNRMKVNARRVFSVPELYNDLLTMEATYAEFKLGETEFGAMCQFVVSCSRYARDDYYIELDAGEFRKLINLFGLSVAAQRRLVYTGKSYVAAINSFAPFINLDGTLLSTVTLLSRFAYNYKTACLNEIKRFQIKSGFMFEKQVKDALAAQGFIVSDIKRIDHMEFDVVATHDGTIYNVQCKNNLIDLTRIEENPRLFSGYNNRLVRYYEKALLKEERREAVLKKRLGLKRIKHVVVSKFPVATKNPRILAFREIDQFSLRFGGLLTAS
jgi:hypothetical protein